MNRASFFPILTLAYATLLLYSSLQPISPPIGPGIPFIDKFLHIIGYFIFTWLLKHNLTPKFSLIFAIGYGIMIEFLQIGVPGRSFDIWDIVANSIGALLAIKIRKKSISRNRQL